MIETPAKYLHRFGLVCLLSAALPLCTPSAAQMDEWQALELSLKYEKSDKPSNGFVPNELTAVRIAEAVASAQYGEARILKERPFRARLYGTTWVVKGTLGTAGGTAVAKINKADGRIVFLTHQE